MFLQVLLGVLATTAVLGAQEDFKPLDPFCFQSAKLLICSKYHRYEKLSCIFSWT